MADIDDFPRYLIIAGALIILTSIVATFIAMGVIYYSPTLSFDGYVLADFYISFSVFMIGVASLGIGFLIDYKRKKKK